MAYKRKTKQQTVVDLAVLAPLDWVDERTGAVRGTKWFLFRNVPRDISWAQTLGFGTLIAFAVQALTGAILAMYYKPASEIDPTTGKPLAYTSIEHITNDLTLGWLVRGMHRWGASVFVILLFMHMGRVFLFGAYKYPRELLWITGVLILVMGMLMGFTGYLLPWDQTAYWATVVGINLNGTAPFAGPWLAQFLAGGPEIGSDTLAKWYALHMLLIPGALIALIGIHLYLVARLGITSPPWSQEAAGRERPVRKPTAGARGKRASRSPERAAQLERQMAKGLGGAEPRVVRALQGRREEGGQGLLPAGDAARHDHGDRRRRRDHRPGDHLVLLAGDSPEGEGLEPGILGPLYAAPAEPGTTDFIPRPDWYFDFLFYLLRIFEWPETVVIATVGIPTVLLVLLIGLPFYDRRRERRPSRWPVAMVAALLTVLSMGVLTYKGATAEESLGSTLIADGVPAEWAEEQGFAGNEQAEAGATLFAQTGCLQCHIYLGRGAGALGAPDLSEIGQTNDAEYFVQYLSNPARFGTP